MASKAVLSHQLHRAAFGQTACALPTDLQIDLCDVDVLPDLIGQDAQEQLAVRIPLVLPHAVQQVVGSLQHCSLSPGAASALRYLQQG